MENIAIDKYHCYIGCLHHSIGDEGLLTLAKCFSDNVVCSKVIRNPSTDSHLGYGFIQYEDVSYADDAIAKMQGISAKGIPLHVRAAYPFTSTTLNSKNQEESQNIKNCTVYVSNLNPTDTEEDLRDMAKPFGELDCVSLIPNRKFGFVTFSRREYALGFICHMDCWNTGGSIISCSWAYQRRSIRTIEEFAPTDFEKEDEIYGSKYALDLLPKEKTSN